MISKLLQALSKQKIVIASLIVTFLCLHFLIKGTDKAVSLNTIDVKLDTIEERNKVPQKDILFQVQAWGEHADDQISDCYGVTYSKSDRISQYNVKDYVKYKRKVIEGADRKRYEELIQKGEIRNVSFEVYRLGHEVAISCNNKPFYLIKEKEIETLPLKFDEKYKNPCWSDSQGRYCLPYFYLIGMPRTGTSDLGLRLRQHPQVTGRMFFYWSPTDLDKGENEYTYRKYLLANSRDIHKKKDGTSFLNIQGDFVPTYMWNFFDTQYVDDSVGHGLPDILHALHPEAKFIVSLRDPVERLLSDYLSEADGYRSPEDFHRRVVRTIRAYSQCKTEMPEIGCIGFEERIILGEKQFTRLSLGLYSKLIRWWLRAFPKDQFIFTTLEERENHCMAAMKKHTEFLEIESYDVTLLAKLCMQQPQKKERSFQMKQATRDLLECFYKPYNADLENLLPGVTKLWQR